MEENYINPEPTKMAVIDPLRLCSLKCRACYYLHGDMKSVRPLDDVKKDIDNAILRGNNALQLTGGEPLLYPQLYELLEYAKSKNLWVSIITSCYANLNILDKILPFIDNFLISIHGLEETHDNYVQKVGARQRQIEFLNKVKDKVSINFNFVINKINQHEILDTAKWMVQWNPNIVNFINMNPHGDWGNKKEETKTIIANLREVEPILNETIELLENNNVGVNLRYYPMCRIAEKYRRCISNDLQVCFDWREWDYDIQPKTFEAFRQWGINTSNNMENKDDCSKCDLQWICGGINKSFHLASDRKMIDIVKDFKGDKNDFYYYRKYNVKPLKRD